MANLKEENKDLYDLIGELNLNLKHLCKLIYAHEINDSTSVDKVYIRFKAKLDGSGSISDDEVGRIEDVLKSFSDKIIQYFENKERRKQRQRKIAALMEHLSDEELENLYSNKVKKK